MIQKLKSFFDVQDMTTGSPLSRLLQFSVPLLFGNLVQQLYSTVDSIVVGKYVGDGALAAVGVSFPVMNLMLVLFMGIATGAGIMVSQYFGAKDADKLGATVGNSITLSFISGLVMTVLGAIIVRPLMTLLDTPADIYEMACTYLTVIFYGIIANMFYNIISGILRGLGDSFMPLIFLLVACFLNIVLDILFVAKYGMGILGVALATIIAQTVSAILCLIRLFSIRHILIIHAHMLRLRRSLVVQMAKLGLPAGLSQGIFALSGIVVQSLTNTFGTDVIACSTMVMRVDGFAMMPNFTFGAAMTTYVGQNIGAGNIKRVDLGTKQGTLLSLITSVVLTSAVVLFGKHLMHLFTQTESIITMGDNMFKILALGYIAMSINQSLSGVMRGAGDTMSPMWISVITTVIIRVPLAYLLAFLSRTQAQPAGSPYSLFISLLICWLLGGVLTYVLYRRGKWRTKGFTDKSVKTL